MRKTNWRKEIVYEAEVKISDLLIGERNKLEKFLHN